MGYPDFQFCFIFQETNLAEQTSLEMPNLDKAYYLSV